MKSSNALIMPLAADAERGEVLLPIGDETFVVRFGLKFLRVFTRQSGADEPAAALNLLATAPLEALVEMVAIAIKLAVPAEKLPAGFDADAATDLLEELPSAQQKEIFSVLLSAVRTNPILAVLTQVPAA